MPDAAVELHPHAHGHGRLGDGDEAHEARDDGRPQVLQHHVVGVRVAIDHLQEKQTQLQPLPSHYGRDGATVRRRRI